MAETSCCTDRWNRPHSHKHLANSLAKSAKWTWLHKIPGYLLQRFLPTQILTVISRGLLGSLWIWSKWMLFYVWHRNITWNKFSSHINTVYLAPVSFIIICFRRMRIIGPASEITFDIFRASTVLCLAKTITTKQVIKQSTQFKKVRRSDRWV